MSQPSTEGLKHLRIEIHGAVQGVGFRPFVYRLATGLGLTGWVINDVSGVFIEVEGPERAVNEFRARLVTEKPPRALIHSLQADELPPAGFDRFEIRHSTEQGAKTALLLPDIATCPDCLTEVLDPADRRQRYPFTNCTNCGPRFSIIEALPYDRPNTSMKRFTMCPACQREYTDPLDRRFHAQPNACPVCGPQLTFYGQNPPHPSSLIPNSTAHNLEGAAALQAAIAALRAGQIVAVKGLGGFLLMVDARNDAAITRLRERKLRRDRPFAIMACDLAQVRTFCEVSSAAAALLTSPEAPIVLLPRNPHPCPPPSGRGRAGGGGRGIAPAVAPGNPYLGVMLPYTPLHHLLLAELGFPVVATSGNLTDEPICIGNDEAFERLRGIADAFLVHDRPIVRHVDDSVAWIVAGAPRLLRRAGGMRPCRSC